MNMFQKIRMKREIRLEPICWLKKCEKILSERSDWTGFMDKETIYMLQAIRDEIKRRTLPTEKGVKEIMKYLKGGQLYEPEDEDKHEK